LTQQARNVLKHYSGDTEQHEDAEVQALAYNRVSRRVTDKKRHDEDSSVVALQGSPTRARRTLGPPTTFAMKTT
jgi:hypothetical protein